MKFHGIRLTILLNNLQNIGTKPIESRKTNTKHNTNDHFLIFHFDDSANLQMRTLPRHMGVNRNTGEMGLVSVIQPPAFLGGTIRRTTQSGLVPSPCNEPSTMANLPQAPINFMTRNIPVSQQQQQQFFYGWQSIMQQAASSPVNTPMPPSILKNSVNRQTIHESPKKDEDGKTWVLLDCGDQKDDAKVEKCDDFGINCNNCNICNKEALDSVGRIWVQNELRKNWDPKFQSF